MSTCFTRDVLTSCILHEQMISFVRKSNDSPSEFLHPRTCVTEERSSPDRETAIYLATRKSELGIDFEKLVRRHEFQLPPFGIALVLLPAMRRTDLKLVILIFYRKCAWCVFRFTFWQSLKYISILSNFGICGLIYSSPIFIKSIQIKREGDIFNFSSNSRY